MQEAKETAPNALVLMSGSFTDTKIEFSESRSVKPKRPSIIKSLSEPIQHSPPTKIKSALRHSSSVGSEATNKKSAGRRRFQHQSVSFDSVHIQEYPIIPGDNPGAVSGVPLTIDWDPQKCLTALVDDYERKRPKRRSAAEFQMPPSVRQNLLRKSGHSLQEIQKYQKKANIVRGQRKATADLSHMSNLSEAKEKVTRGLSNLTLKRSKKQKEREFLKQHAAPLSTTVPCKTKMQKEESTDLTELVVSDDEETEC